MPPARAAPPSGSTRPRPSRPEPALARHPYTRRARSRANQFAQHERQDSAVPDVLDLLGRIHSQRRLELDRLAGRLRAHLHRLARLDSRLQSRDREYFIPGESELLPIFAALELECEHAHPNQIAAMDSLEALRDYRAHAEQLHSLGGPIARRARAVFLAAITISPVPALR